MSEFTASNGIQVRPGRVAGLLVGCDGAGRVHDLSDGEVDAAREFFQHERDEELGRWRYPLDPDYVVYPDPGLAFLTMFGPGIDLVVLRESDGMTKGYVQAEDEGGEPFPHRAGHIRAARAYFEAHAERKPWEDAEDRELWILTIDGKEDDIHVLRSDEAGFRFFPARSTVFNPGAFPNEVTAGRRIWPEDAS